MQKNWKLFHIYTLFHWNRNFFIYLQFLMTRGSIFRIFNPRKPHPCIWKLFHTNFCEEETFPCFILAIFNDKGLYIRNFQVKEATSLYLETFSYLQTFPNRNKKSMATQFFEQETFLYLQTFSNVLETFSYLQTFLNRKS